MHAWPKAFVGLSPSLPLSLNAFSTHHHTSITILDCMMGCNASTIGADGANLPAATRLRPLVLRQLAEMRTWRLPAFPARATPYKKGLLLESDKEQTTTAPSTAFIAANPYVVKVAAKLNQIRASRKNHTPKLQIATARSKSIDDRKADGDDDDDYDDEGRMIGAWPGSPSFRVFFEDAARAALVDQNGIYTHQKFPIKMQESSMH